MNDDLSISATYLTSVIDRDSPSTYRVLDEVRADQSQKILELTGKMLAALGQGFNTRSAQIICDLLLPATEAIAIAITSREKIMGFAGVGQEENTVGSEIRSNATREVMEEGTMRIIRSPSEIGLPEKGSEIKAAIITPLRRGGNIIGTLKFYYPNVEFLTETQRAIAHGFGEMLSSQLDATALYEQHSVATSMELKMLQSQINPHFLFNTINTIASLVRTDPDQARKLLREFATFYRSTLEDSGDLITLAREVAQTKRYLSFARARFGEDRIQYTSDIPDEISEYLIPSFVIKPLVENSVRHGMRSEGTLHIQVRARRMYDALVVTISDDGVGMSADAAYTLENPEEEQEGLGLAMRNIKKRINGYYGPDSRMSVASTPGHGTTVELYLHNACHIDETTH